MFLFVHLPRWLYPSMAHTFITKKTFFISSTVDLTLTFATEEIPASELMVPVLCEYFGFGGCGVESLFL
jgi:hypothetical protein